MFRCGNQQAHHVACWHKTDVAVATVDVRFSNRPFGVKRFQTIHHHSVDVAHGLVLLFGIGTRALPSWDSRTGWNNLSGGLAVNRTAGPSGHTNSPHPSSRKGHLSTARWSSGFLLSGLILNGFHAAAATCSRVHRNSVPSTQMRCMITASRRASATIAFSNRPFGVKHFQTIHQCGVDVARGLVLLFGIGTEAFPSWDSRTRRNNLLVGLAVEERRVQADIRTHLIHRPARDIFPPLGGARVFSYRV